MLFLNWTFVSALFWHSAMENSYKVQFEDIMKQAHRKICYLTERLVSSVVENAQLTTELARQTAENARLKIENARLRSCDTSKLRLRVAELEELVEYLKSVI
jgi:hypothetical protein